MEAGVLVRSPRIAQQLTGKKKKGLEPHIHRSFICNMVTPRLSALKLISVSIIRQNAYKREFFGQFQFLNK